LSFALRYLNLFNKAATLSSQVSLKMSNETPLVIEYEIPKLGFIRFYLAPKINEDENWVAEASVDISYYEKL